MRLTHLTGKAASAALGPLSLIIALTLLSLQIKTPGMAAIRPLYYGAIALLFVTTIFLFSRLLRASTRFQVEAWTVIVWLSALYLYMLVHAVPVSTRALKDFILGASVDAGCLILLLGHQLRDQAACKRALRPLAFAISAFGVVAALIAWSGYFGWLQMELYGQEFPHNPAWATRIHGWLGEPTQLGAAIGLAVLTTLYLVAVSPALKMRVLGYATLLLLGAALYGAGSRNGLLSAMVGSGVMIVLWRNARQLLGAASLATFVGGFFVMVLMVHLVGPESDFLSRLGARFPGYSAAELHLVEAFRFNDPGDSVARLERFARVAEIYLDNTVLQQIFGAGYGFTRKVYAAAQNDYLESIVDFGALFLALLLAYFVYLQRLLLGMIRSGDAEVFGTAILATCLLAFSAVFALNQSSLFPDLFQFANFAHLLTASLVVAAYAYRTPRAAATESSELRDQLGAMPSASNQSVPLAADHRSGPPVSR